MSARTLVVTGTDTGVGKTAVACALIRAARARRIAVCGFKPVATGCADGPEGLRNDDALALREASGTDEPYERINPCAYAPAIAPHLAAAEAGTPIRIATLDHAHAQLAGRHRLIVLEGAGGWQVPFDERWTFASWIGEHEWPVLLVVGMRLGCLNHALLTAEAIARRTRLAGWIASVLPPRMPRLDENLATLRARLPGPCWGVLQENATRLDSVAGRALAAFLA
ncbi:MAG TPA: dethiobiotin synthase [Candidatus Binatia bacterium]|nr:dethiobiotin synthase [Candidatus Binatia bacterium]